MRSCFFNAPAASISRDWASRESSATFMCLRSVRLDELGAGVGAAAGMSGLGEAGDRGGDRAAWRPREEAGAEGENVFAPARRVNEAGGDLARPERPRAGRRGAGTD